ncbi:hypothetical protein AVEN_133974-1 [Araneus ventricosus]|uniref:Uncharacterized protein n=1 Tax=Araneus ventricosus TaxID=182803 RepID=A0A4Y2VQL0_ARAVE|nr:hypothetical protein AVEN_133974-1 [Araneus ventricosus]
MTRTTSNLVPSPPSFHPTPAGGRLTHDVKFNVHQVRIHGTELQKESSFEPGSLRPLTRGWYNLGNSIRDETLHISSLPLGCSPISLIKCNGQPIRRKWPSSFEHSLYTRKQ